MKLEVKKINKKINLDTTMEGCSDSCIEHNWVNLTRETSYGGVKNCYEAYLSPKGNPFFT